MSDDNVYEFEDNDQSAFNIPDAAVEKESKSEQASASEREETPEEENDDDEYDPSIPDDEEKKEEEPKEEEPKELGKPQEDDEDNLYASENEDESESTKAQDPPKDVTEPVSKPKKEKKRVTFQVPEKEDENEEEEQKEEEEEDDEGEDDYDPTAEISDSPLISSTTSSPASTISQLSTSVNSPSGANNLQSYASKIMSSNLLSDPEFLKLSDSEKQQRILQELKSPTFTNASLSSPYTPSSIPQLPGSNLGASADFRPNLRIAMTNEEIAKYNSFVDNEAKYATSRHTPAPNSRLFVGNLPSNSISKQDLFRLFSRYGTILQISLKGSYGFIQYTDAMAVEKAIEQESKAPLNGKDLMLQIAKNSKPGQQQEGGALNDRKRSREDFNDQYVDDRSNTRRKKDIEVKILVKKNADPRYTKDVNRQFHNANINSEYEFLKPHMVLKEKTNEAAYGGCIGVVLINRNRTCDVQTYEKAIDGSIKFDEFSNVTADDATGLLLRAKQNQYNNNHSSNNNNNRSGFGGQSQGGFQQQQSPSFGQQPNFFQQPQQQAPPAIDPQQQQLLQSLSNLPPTALQNLMALAQGQQPQVQQQQPAFQNPYQQFQPQQPQQPAANPALNLASLLGQVSQQQQQQPPTQYPFNNYQQPQAQFAQPQSAPGLSPPQNQAQPGPSLSVKDLMANLQKFK